MRQLIGIGLALLVFGPFAVRGEEPVPLAPGVRGLVTLASTKVEVDGKLREWSQAFCTPLSYNHKSPENRAAQFYYMWDDEALYLGLRCLDKVQVNHGKPGEIYNGDAVEFYLDTRPDAGLRGKDWSAGAIHFYYSPFEGVEIKPRWVIRKGIATSNVVLKGVEIAASQNTDSYEVEFKLPWANFPEFSPKLGAVLALDAELCSSDGKSRTDRTFSYGSPLSVQQPASLGKVELVKSFDPDYLSVVGPSSFPLWVDTPWTQSERAQVQAVVAIPPEFAEIVGYVEIRIHDADGKIIKTIPALVESFGPEGARFRRAVARWSIDDFAPNTYFATAKIVARTEKTLATVAPRMVAEGIITGR